MFAKTLTSNDFILDESTGLYIATVLATTHGLGVPVTVCKMLKRDDDGNWCNAMPTFKIETNGDVRIYASEPGIYRISILDTQTRTI